MILNICIVLTILIISFIIQMIVILFDSDTVDEYYNEFVFTESVYIISNKISNIPYIGKILNFLLIAYIMVKLEIFYSLFPLMYSLILIERLIYYIRNK